MNIKVFQNRKIEKCYFYNEGTQNENDSSILTFDVPQEYEDYIKRIVFITEDGNFWDYINENKYILKNNVTKYGILSAYLWLTKDTKDFRTEQFELNFYDNKNPDDVVPSEEQVDGFATMIKILEEKIDEVEVLKIDIGDFKQALDSKVDKKEGYGLSQNDFTNELKTTLENLENYDDTEIKESVENIKNDLTNYYKKSETYNKEEIDNKISKIPKMDIEVVDSLPTENISEEKLYLVKSGAESENLYTEYIYVNGKWEKLGEQKLNISHLATKIELEEVKTELNAEIERLTTENEQQAEQINYLDKTLTRAEASGENINIKNSAEYPISEISIDTNIKQDSREGYNKVNNIVAGYGTAQNEDGSFYNTITSDWVSNQIRFDNINISSGEVLYISCDVKKVSGTYSSVLSAIIPRNSSGIALNAIEEKIERPTLDNNYKRSIFKYTFNEDANIDRLVLQVNGNENTADDVVLNFKNIMISNENKPYEQYGSMPSIEFPSEIKTPVGKQEVVVGNKNIFKPSIKVDDTNIARSGCKLTLTDDEYSFVATSTDIYFGQVTKAGNTYTKDRGPLYNVKGKSKIYFLLTGENLKHIYYTFFNKDKISLGYKTLYSNNGSIDISENAEYMTFRFGNASATIGETYKTKVMLAFEEITEYVKYQSQVQDLDVGELLGPIVDKEDGSYFENRYEKYIFTGEEGMIKSSITTLDRYIVNTNVENFVKGSGPKSNLCNYFKSGLGNIGYMGTDDNGDSGKQRAIFEYAKTGTTTLADFRAKLRELYASGNPVELLYPLATPTYTKLTDEQQAQWNKIKKMHTYEGVTNIYTINDNGISPVINMKYVKSPKVVEENLQAQIDKINSAIVALGANV